MTEIKEYNDRMNKLDLAIGEFTNYFEMAKKFLNIQPLYFDDVKIWWIWNFELKYWEKIDDVNLMISLDKAVRSIKTLEPKQKAMIIDALQREARNRMPKELPKTWVHIGANLVDIMTGSSIEASPEYFTTNPIPWTIGDTEDTPTIDKLFTEWVGEANRPLLYEIIAYCMLSDYPIHRIFCFIGVGRNGKSKAIELLRRFIGYKNVCATDLDILLASRFESAKLYRKLVCIMGETNFDSIKRTSILKRLTGQDSTGFEFKNKTPFDNMNYAKIIIATNSLPVTEDKTDGFYRRWQIIRFPNQFTEKLDPLENIPEQEYRNLAKKCIRILIELLQKREFTNEGSVEYRKSIYDENSDAVTVFIEQECSVDNVNSEISFQEFYAVFKAFCKKQGLRELSAKMVGKLLYELGFERYNKSVGATSISTIKGLKIKRIDISPW